MEEESAYHSLQWNTVFSSQVNLILLSCYLFLLPPSFVSSEVAFNTKYLEVCLSIRKGVRLAYKLILVAQGVEF